MTKKISFLAATTGIIAAAVFVAFVSSAQIALAAHPSGAVGYWALDDGADPTADTSGHGNYGTISGSAVYTGSGIAPVPGNTSALTFDGTDDYVTVAHDDDLDMTGAYSLSAWVNVTDVPVGTYRPIAFRGAPNRIDMEVYVQWEAAIS